MNRLRVLISFVALISSFLLLPSFVNQVEAYNCLPSRYCSTDGGVVEGAWWRNSSTTCTTARQTYSCSGTDSNCSGGINIYSSEYDCARGVNPYFAGCCNSGTPPPPPPPPCNDCTPASCPAGTTTTDTGYYHSQTSCDRGSGCDPRYNTRNCYCNTCTPPSCSPTYSDSNLGYGSTTTSCYNGCANQNRTCYCYSCTPPACAPNYSTVNYGYGIVSLSCTNACSVKTTNTCYIDRCSNCSLSSCPTPLTNTPGTTNPNMELTRFRTCTRNQPCGGAPNYGSCYEVVSPQPTTSLQIFPEGVNTFGFSSSTHTGTRTNEVTLNDPIEMTATYSDPNGVNDIEAISVWFRDTSITGEVESPLWFAQTGGPAPKIPTNNSWGFMLRWNGSSWTPYVPAYPSTGNPTWVSTLYSNNSFDISGPTGVKMVRVTIGNSKQANITRVGNNVVLPFELSFNFSTGYDPVGQVQYNTYLMGNDVFSFTPSDNYSFSVESYWQAGQLRYRTSPLPAQLYARQWMFTGKTWTVDKEEPEVEKLSISVIGDTKIRLNIEVADTKEIYAIVGNLYASLSMPPNPDPLVLTGSGMDIKSSYTLVKEEDNKGYLNSEYAFKAIDIGGTAYTNYLDIDLGSNTEGSIVVYLRVYDMAGNMDISSLTYSLGDWIATYGGFVYSSQGKNYEMKNIEDSNAWDTQPLLTDLDPTLADVSTELFADNQSSGTLPSALDKSTQLKSYHMRPFAMNINIPSLFEELKDAYNSREIEGKADLNNVVPAITALNGNLTSMGNCNPSSKVCILKTLGDLNVGNNSAFKCNQWGVFFVNGNLNISNDITNENRYMNACIFVVSGNVNIYTGINHSNASQMGYDEINAYIMADGEINVSAETGTTTKYDGLYIAGGLHSLRGINMNRSLKLADRNIFPAMFVRYQPKYSVLSNLVFGSQVDILKTEVGFKPY